MRPMRSSVRKFKVNLRLIEVYDFKVGKVIFEYDGKQTHNNDGTLNGRDSKKERLASKNGYKVLRIPYKIDGRRSDVNIAILRRYIKTIIKPWLHILK